MDHFALPHESAVQGASACKLHRNFIEYTTTDTELLIGLSASAISDARYAYAQSSKKGCNRKGLYWPPRMDTMYLTPAAHLSGIFAASLIRK